MYLTSSPAGIRSDYGIKTKDLDRRITLRMDRDTSKCLELGFAAATTSDLYPFKDRSTLVRFLIHEFYREVVEKKNMRRPAPPVRFTRPDASI